MICFAWIIKRLSAVFRKLERWFLRQSVKYTSISCRARWIPRPWSRGFVICLECFRVSFYRMLMTKPENPKVSDTIFTLKTNLEIFKGGGSTTTCFYHKKGRRQDQMKNRKWQNKIFKCLVKRRLQTSNSSRSAPVPAKWTLALCHIR